MVRRPTYCLSKRHFYWLLLKLDLFEHNNDQQMIDQVIKVWLTRNIVHNSSLHFRNICRHTQHFHLHSLAPPLQSCSIGWWPHIMTRAQFLNSNFPHKAHSIQPLFRPEKTSTPQKSKSFSKKTLENYRPLIEQKREQAKRWDSNSKKLIIITDYTAHLWRRYAISVR